MGFKLKRLLKQPKKILKTVSDVYKPIKKLVSPVIKNVVGSIPLLGPLALGAADVVRGVRKSLRGAISKEDRAEIRDSFQDFNAQMEAEQALAAQQQQQQQVQQITNPYLTQQQVRRVNRRRLPMGARGVSRGPWGMPLPADGGTAFNTAQFMRFRRSMTPQVQQQQVQRQRVAPPAVNQRTYFSSGRFFR